MSSQANALTRLKERLGMGTSRPDKGAAKKELPPPGLPTPPTPAPSISAEIGAARPSPTPSPGPFERTVATRLARVNWERLSVVEAIEPAAPFTQTVARRLGAVDWERTGEVDGPPPMVSAEADGSAQQAQQSSQSVDDFFSNINW